MEKFDAIIVGAGLAGAALVRSLCRAGVPVTWLDAAAGPAAAASALPPIIFETSMMLMEPTGSLVAELG